MTLQWRFEQLLSAYVTHECMLFAISKKISIWMINIFSCYTFVLSLLLENQKAQVCDATTAAMKNLNAGLTKNSALNNNKLTKGETMKIIKWCGGLD
jgi:hypothetical protein